MADLTVFGGGSVFILKATSPRGSEWAKDNIAVTEETIFAFGGVVVEHRYITAIIDGAQRDGLTVETERAS